MRRDTLGARAFKNKRKEKKRKKWYEKRKGSHSLFPLSLPFPFLSFFLETLAPRVEKRLTRIELNRTERFITGLIKRQESANMNLKQTDLLNTLFLHFSSSIWMTVFAFLRLCFTDFISVSILDFLAHRLYRLSKSGSLCIGCVYIRCSNASIFRTIFLSWSSLMFMSSTGSRRGKPSGKRFFTS